MAPITLNWEQEATRRTELFKDTEVRALTQSAVLVVSESPGTERNAGNGGAFHKCKQSTIVKEIWSSN